MAPACPPIISIRWGISISRFEYANLPCWLIFNGDFYARCVLAGGLTDDFVSGQPPPQWIAGAATLCELAERVGIDADQLEATVTRFNAHAAEGIDPDFRRGESANDLWWGDSA